MLADLVVRAPEPGDIAAIGDNLRPADLREVQAMIGGCSPREAVRASIELSPIVGVACADGRPVFVIGCAPNGDGSGAPWMVGTAEADRYPVAMTKTTKQFINRFLEQWPRLLNYVDERNVASVRWLDRLGFTIREPINVGLQGEPFHPFTMGF